MDEELVLEREQEQAQVLALAQELVLRLLWQPSAWQSFQPLSQMHQWYPETLSLRRPSPSSELLLFVYPSLDLLFEYP
jgi:hypothetical protein